jgi:hypothetical protein
VRAGDEVTLQYWRAEIRGVVFGTATQATRDGGWRLPLGIALVLLPMGLLSLWLSWWYRYRHPSAEKDTPRWFLLVAMPAIAVGVTGFWGCN